MAVIEEKEKQERKFIDPLAGDLEAGEAVELDTEADAFERTAPPPMGRYDLHITLAKEAWEEVKTDSRELYYRVNLECKIVDAPDPEINGTMVFARLSTFLGRGKKISTMAHVLLKMGYPKEKLAGAISPKDLMVKFHKFVTKQDRFVKGCLLDWQGYSPAQKAVIYNKMADFPKGPDGQYKHIVEYRKAGSPSEEIIARLRLKDWGESGSLVAGKVATKPKAGPVVIKASAVAAAASDDDEDTPAPPPAKKAKASAKPSEAELSALLDGDDD